MANGKPRMRGAFLMHNPSTYKHSVPFSSLTLNRCVQSRQAPTMWPICHSSSPGNRISTRSLGEKSVAFASGSEAPSTSTGLEGWRCFWSFCCNSASDSDSDEELDDDKATADT